MSLNPNSTKKCFMIPVSHSGNTILLPDGVVITIGRSPESGITDLTCSRHQVTVKADYSNELVSVKTIGNNPSYFNQKPMVSNKDYCLRSDHIIELVPGKVCYKVAFTSTKEEPEQVMSYFWKMCGSEELLMCTSSKFDEKRVKVASFDLDGTLIKTKSGRVFAKDFDDWELWNDCIKIILRNLNANDFKIIIFTNQAGLGTVSGKRKVDGFQKKIENILNLLDVPVQVFIAVSNGLYRKPSPGMWYFMRERSHAADVSRSFYVGDAAGRPENWKLGKKADFSVCDRMFAINVGLKFYTPEEYFLKEPVANYTPFMFHPSQKSTENLPNLEIPPTSQEVILMVGLPGSGKSYLVQKYIKPYGYCIISRDKTGSWQKCVSLLKEALKENRNAVVDNINPDRVSRERFIEICVQCNVKVRCFIMDVPLERCLHNNKFREIFDSEHEIIGSSLITSYKSNFEPPSLEEGFSSIVKIPFVPQFDNREQEHFYNCFLVDK
ncbi:uncharacterized protein F21D5.5 [Halyomorpha halys]|uniref:uncharacterized protein F21D5.5 n=1 Tax=Halyomorpha halys TaxID=286706 RepID=UPI0006D4CC41|nr:uncharacterized protein F21D5.5-like [Halyomorpha halys]